MPDLFVHVQVGAGPRCPVLPTYRDRIRALSAELDGKTDAIAAALTAEVSAPSGRTSSVASEFLAPWVINYNLGLHAETDRGDVGYFAGRDAHQRIKVAAHVFELGEYLGALRREGGLHLPPMMTSEKLSYFPLPPSGAEHGTTLA